MQGLRDATVQDVLVVACFLDQQDKLVEADNALEVVVVDNIDGNGLLGHTDNSWHVGTGFGPTEGQHIEVAGVLVRAKHSSLVDGEPCQGVEICSLSTPAFILC